MKDIISLAIYLLPFAGIAQDRKADSIEYRNLITPINEKLNRLNASEISDTSNAKEAIKELQKKYNDLTVEYIAACTLFYKGHFNSYIGLKAYVNAVSFSKNKEKLVNDFYRFSTELQSSELGKSIFQKLKSITDSNKAAPGKIP